MTERGMACRKRWARGSNLGCAAGAGATQNWLREGAATKLGTYSICCLNLQLQINCKRLGFTCQSVLLVALYAAIMAVNVVGQLRR